MAKTFQKQFAYKIYFQPDNLYYSSDETLEGARAEAKRILNRYNTKTV